jgi:hypothetical protein
MNHQTNKVDTFVEGKLVAVIGGTIDCAGNLHEEIRICRTIHVGEKDILVNEVGSFTEKFAIIPKSLCIPLPATFQQVESAEILRPRLGDLVLYYGRLDWKEKKVSTVTGILCEITHRFGTTYRAKLLSGGEMKEVPFGDILVLQRKDGD